MNTLSFPPIASAFAIWFGFHKLTDTASFLDSSDAASAREGPMKAISRSSRLGTASARCTGVGRSRHLISSPSCLTHLAQKNCATIRAPKPACTVSQFLPGMVQAKEIKPYPVAVTLTYPLAPTPTKTPISRRAVAFRDRGFVLDISTFLMLGIVFPFGQLVVISRLSWGAAMDFRLKETPK